MTEAVSFDPCRVQGCKAQARLDSYFCPAHEVLWVESPECKRAKQVGIAEHSLSMLGDFAIRMHLEGK